LKGFVVALAAALTELEDLLSNFSVVKILCVLLSLFIANAVYDVVHVKLEPAEGLLGLLEGDELFLDRLLDFVVRAEGNKQKYFRSMELQNIRRDLRKECSKVLELDKIIKAISMALLLLKIIWISRVLLDFSIIRLFSDFHLT
jgi:type III secretory pathway component EscS